MNISVRNAAKQDIAAIAEIWQLGWHDGHADIVPAELTILRSAESFLARSISHLAEARVAEKNGNVIGFSMLKDAEVYQFYVARAGRGTGVAKLLAQDAEQEFRVRGITSIWLSCSIGNDRAARFYEKSGWIRTRTEVVPLEVPSGEFALKVWRYEKELT